MGNNSRTLGIILIITHLVALIAGVALVNYANSPSIASKTLVSETDSQDKIDYMTMKEQYEKMNDRITLLENQNMDYIYQITSLGKIIVEKDTEISNLESEIKSLKNDILLLNFRFESQNNKVTTELWKHLNCHNSEPRLLPQAEIIHTFHELSPVWPRGLCPTPQPMRQ